MTRTVKDLTKHFGVNEHTVLRWIRNGELKAVDVSRERGGRPQWRITEEALMDFEISRTSADPAPPRTRRKKQGTGVIEFY